MDGEIFKNIGKYARGAVLYAFEEVGGPDGLADWAKSNPDDFYTKLFPKIIAREAEVHHTRSVDEIAEILDGDYESVEDDDADVSNLPAGSVMPSAVPAGFFDSDEPYPTKDSLWGSDDPWVAPDLAVEFPDE